MAVFEDPNYDVKNRDMARKVQDLMNQVRLVAPCVSTEDCGLTCLTPSPFFSLRQMQDCGSPPKEIVGDMPPELENMPGLGGEDGECCIM